MGDILNNKEDENGRTGLKDKGRESGKQKA
jgi:hypothetical protein